MKRFLWKNIAVIIAVIFAAGCAAPKAVEKSDPQTSAMTTARGQAETLLGQMEQLANKIAGIGQSFEPDEIAKTVFRIRITKDVTLPIISVNTGGEEILSLEEYVVCTVDVFNCEEAWIIESASAGIRVRGNSSAYYGDVDQIRKNPVPYRIKFDSKTNLLGMNDGAECKSWVLLKNDWDLIRNDIAFRFGRTIIGENTFCSDARFVHLYINNKFAGVYLLCEQSQINPNRVDITEPEEGYTGTDIGYYFELDNYAWSEPEKPFIQLDYGRYTVTDVEGETREFVPAEYSIKNDVFDQEQIDFADKYLNNVFEIVYRACERGEYLTFDENYDLVESEFDNAEDTVRAVMDVQSAIDMYLLYEIVHDYDCGEGSFYLCVDFAKDSKCPKLQFTSPWDFNWAYDGSTTRYWAAAFCEQSFAEQYGDRSNPWFIVLMKQDWFAKLASEKWTKLQNEGKIDGCVKEEIRLLEVYKDDLNRDSDSAVDGAFRLIEWIENRIDWMDETFLKK